MKTLLLFFIFVIVIGCSNPVVFNNEEKCPEGFRIMRNGYGVCYIETLSNGEWVRTKNVLHNGVTYVDARFCDDRKVIIAQIKSSIKLTNLDVILKLEEEKIEKGKFKVWE